MGVIPIVNENDTIAVTEIKFGDNDTLSAITAAMVHADYLFLMTDVDCLYDKNPRTNPDAQPIEVVKDISELTADGKFTSSSQTKTYLTLYPVSSAGSSLGTGGMYTKIVAARLATSAGVTTIIARSSNPGNLVNIVRYLQAIKISSNSSSPRSLSRASTRASTPAISHTPMKSMSSSTASLALDDPLARSTASLHLEATLTAPLHTRFEPSSHPIRDRSFWLLHGLAPHGTIYIDSGAHAALKTKSGLLPVGVVDVEGSFAQQECVRLVVVDRCMNTKWSPGKIWKEGGEEVGRALVNYSAAEIARIRGARSQDIAGLLGYADSSYVALRENISFYERESRPATPLSLEPQEDGVLV